MDTTSLIIAYVAIAVLLLGLNLYSSWNWFVKSATNIIVVGFFWVVYHSWPAVQGWPIERDLPDQFYLHAVIVDEPERIYLWGTEFQHGLSQSVPRAYSLAYTPALHDKVDKASRKLRKGLPVIGKVSNTVGIKADLTNLEQTNITNQDVVFVDAPQALVPGKN